MHFDVPSLMLMESFVQLFAGLVLVFAWWQDRRTRVLLLWGLGLVLAGTGILCTDIGATVGPPVWYAIGGTVLSISGGLMWRAVRTFDGRRAPWVLALAGVATVVVVGALPPLRAHSEAISLAVGVVYMLLATLSIWKGRRGERLPARIPLAVLIAVQTLTLAIGVYSALVGELVVAIYPTLPSLFGIIHFESIVFSLGTTAFFLVLVRERREAEMAVAARTDGLTGIANRAAFVEGAERLIERCRRAAVPVTVLMFDLDHFKSVNDNHGHAAGDEAIRKFCEVASDMLRPSDLLGRLGGEEFAVVMPGVGASAAIVRAERIRASYAEQGRIIGGVEIDSTVSCGVTTSEDASHGLTALLDLADTALYRAKAEGRNRVEVSGIPQKSPKSNVLRVA